MSIDEIVRTLNEHEYKGIRWWRLTLSGDGVYPYGTPEKAMGFSEAHVVASQLRDGLQAPPAEPVAEEDDGEKTAKALRYVVEGLEQAAASAERNGDEFVNIKAELYSCGLWLPTARNAIRAIKALLEAKPAVEPVAPSEPSAEECVAAINRAKHRGYADWEIRAASTKGILERLNQDELLGLGRLLIDRERAEAAKGGASC